MSKKNDRFARKIQKGDYADLPQSVLESSLRSLERNLKALEIFPHSLTSEAEFKSKEDELSFQIYKIRKELLKRVEEK